ncbi:hypothetical protein CRUP_018350 [Coryphaenoides rupestris]|nr:hypothetical protein CRUP_018350 [Coryphaenoides rupestris]
MRGLTRASERRTAVWSLGRFVSPPEASVGLPSRPARANSSSACTRLMSWWYHDAATVAIVVVDMAAAGETGADMMQISWPFHAPRIRDPCQSPFTSWFASSPLSLGVKRCYFPSALTWSKKAGSRPRKTTTRPTRHLVVADLTAKHFLRPPRGSFGKEKKKKKKRKKKKEKKKKKKKKEGEGEEGEKKEQFADDCCSLLGLLPGFLQPAVESVETQVVVVVVVRASEGEQSVFWEKNVEEHDESTAGAEEAKGSDSPLQMWVFKKTSGNGDMTLMLGRRDFVDHVTSVDVVVYVYLACAFRYGSEELDVIGLSFRRDVWIKRVQIYPYHGLTIRKTAMQESLLKKAGEQGYPFSFEACGVDFEVKAYIANAADNPDEVIHKKDTCRLMIRKIQFSPEGVKAGPKVQIPKPLEVEASLDKANYFHGDSIAVTVKVNNETSKAIKTIKISVEQTTTVVLYSSDVYTKSVCSEEHGLLGSLTGRTDVTLE